MQNVNSTGYQGATSIVGGLTLDAFVAASTALANAAQTLTGSSTTQAITPAAFAGNKALSSSGYYKFPGGLMIQWGQTGNIATTGTAITWPTPFSAVYAAVCTASYGGTSQASNVSAISTTGATFTVGAVACPVFYVAMGAA